MGRYPSRGETSVPTLGVHSDGGGGNPPTIPLNGGMISKFYRCSTASVSDGFDAFGSDGCHAFGAFGSVSPSFVGRIRLRRLRVGSLGRLRAGFALFALLRLRVRARFALFALLPRVRTGFALLLPQRRFGGSLLGQQRKVPAAGIDEPVADLYVAVSRYHLETSTAQHTWLMFRPVSCINRCFSSSVG